MSVHGCRQHLLPINRVSNPSPFIRPSRLSSMCSVSAQATRDSLHVSVTSWLQRKISRNGFLKLWGTSSERSAFSRQNGKNKSMCEHKKIWVTAHTYTRVSHSSVEWWLIRRVRSRRRARSAPWIKHLTLLVKHFKHTQKWLARSC